MKRCNKCHTDKELSEFRNRGTCRACEKAYEQSRAAKKAEYRRQWALDNPDKIKAYDQKATERARRKSEQKKAENPPSSRIYIITCKITGKTFVSRTPRKYSSFGVKLKASADAATCLSSRWPKGERVCSECGNAFIGTPKAKYCSKECGAKHITRTTRSTRRARVSGAPIVEIINPFKVFQAFNWRCACCGKNTPRELAGTLEDNAPTIDHVIPLSKGGQHSYSNVQCLCRLCNWSKGNMLNPTKDIILLKSLHHQLNQQIYATEQAIGSR